MEPEWEKGTLRCEKEHVGTFEESNEGYEACPTSWGPTLDISTSVSHTFTLQTPQNVPGQLGGDIILIILKRLMEIRDIGRDCNDRE